MGQSRMQNGLTALLVGLVGSTASAQVPNCDRAVELLRGLEAKIQAGATPLETQLVSSMNRLGYGINARSSLNPVHIAAIEAGRGRSAAAALIADAIRGSMRGADRMSAAVTDRVGQIYPGTYGPGFEGRLPAIHKAFTATTGDENITYSSDLKRSIIARKYLAATVIKDYNVGEVLGDFWFNHFNVSDQKVRALDYEIELRRRVCGTFAEMLLASARHAAMSSYLDNDTNRAGQLNENYAREIIELHTLGVGPVTFDEQGRKRIIYEQGEVVEAAKLLTGWRASNSSGFFFDFSRHDKSTKRFTVLFGASQNFVGGPDARIAESEGVRFIRKLANHPLTRRNVCRKLAKHLLGRNISPGMLRSCVEAYGTDGDLPRVYASLLQHEDFWSEGLIQKGFKTPFELLVSANRAMGISDLEELTANHDGFRRLVNRQAFAGLAAMGQPIYRIGPPTGYDVGISYWNTPVTLNQQMNQILSLDRLTSLVDGSRGNLRDLALEDLVTRKLAENPTEALRYVMRDLAPVLTSSDQKEFSGVQQSLIRERRFDRVSASPTSRVLPLRTLMTQLVSSATFMKK